MLYLEMAFLLLSLISVALSATCLGTTGLNSTTTCAMLTPGECNHKYLSFGSITYGCYLWYTGQCITYPTRCTPICNGTWAASSCSNVPVNRCHRYYQVDSVGAHYCGYNPTTAQCEVRLPKIYCTPGYGIYCNSSNAGGDEHACTTLTTQAACVGAYSVQTNGQKNKCEWDGIHQSCYTGVPCWTGVPITHP